MDEFEKEGHHRRLPQVSLSAFIGRAAQAGVSETQTKMLFINDLFLVIITEILITLRISYKLY